MKISEEAKFLSGYYHHYCSPEKMNHEPGESKDSNDYKDRPKGGDHPRLRGFFDGLRGLTSRRAWSR